MSHNVEVWSGDKLDQKETLGVGNARLIIEEALAKPRN